MATFGEILEELRKDRSMSQKDLSKIIFVTTGTISNYENGHYLPDFEKLIILADFFNVSTDYLLGRSTSNLSPDVLQTSISQKMTIGDLINDFLGLSPERKKALMQIMHDMKISMMIDEYGKGEKL